MVHRLPSLIVGVILAAYWARVMWMARRSRKLSGHSANFIPRERLGRRLRMAWIPVVGLWVALPWMNATGRFHGFWMRPVFSWAIAAWFGAILAAAAFGVTWICWKKMGRNWRMGIDPAERGELLVSGPWGWVRHPIYALSSVLMLATVIAVPTALMAMVAVIHLALLQWEARREEKYLAARHGESYVAYCGRVGRFIPRLKE